MKKIGRKMGRRRRKKLGKKWRVSDCPEWVLGEEVNKMKKKKGAARVAVYERL